VTTATKARSKPAAPDDDPLVSLPELLIELGTPGKPLRKSTFYDWLAKGKAPDGFHLPNNQWRFRRSEINRWRAALGDKAA
jgi:predicted DNA-binding transcriptional regulator AlpA